MNYIYKLLIVILFLYVLFKCFSFKEGFESSKDGKKLRKKICDKFVETNVDKINIRNLNYDKSHVCKKDNFFFTSKNISMDDKNDPIVNCRTNVENAKKKNKINKTKLPDPNLKEGGNNLNLTELQNYMNCYVLGKTNSNPDDYNINYISQNEILGDNGFYKKHTLNDYKILGSYNSSCVYNDEDYEAHDLDQITFLFNLGVRYFDFSIIQKKAGESADELIVTCAPNKEGQILNKKSNTEYVTLDGVLKNIGHNIHSQSYPPQRKINNLYENTTNGAHNSNDPLIIHLNICTSSDNDKDMFDNIYKKIKKNIEIDRFFTQTSQDKQVNSNMENILHISIDSLKGKVILLVDIFTYYIDRTKNNREPANIGDRSELFNKSKLATITSGVVYHQKNRQNIKNSLPARSKLNNYKEINVLDVGTLDLSDNNNFYILVPAKATRCSETHKKNTYLCPVTQHFKNGVNVIAFPFYLANDSKTGDNLSEYYELFNNIQSDDSKTSSAFKIKNPSHLNHDARCEVSLIPPDTTDLLNKRKPTASLINDESKKLTKEEKKAIKNKPNPKKGMFNYNIK